MNIDNLKYTHDQITQWIDKADNKANIFLAVKLFILGYILENTRSGSTGCNGFLISFLIFSGISFFYILRVVYPRLGTDKPKSFIFFRHLSDLFGSDKKKGIESFDKRTDDDFKNDLSEQIISISGVATRKYMDIRSGTIFLILEITLAVAVLLSA
jgi:hypothetical protein